MEYILAIGLTFVLSIAIIILATRRSVSGIKKIKYSQTLIHSQRKHLVPQGIKKKIKKSSQISKYAENKIVKVIMIDNLAYWVKDNIFYTAETKDDQIVSETARPVDVEGLSKNDLDKMLFILDNLGKGKNRDDSSSSGD